MIRLMAAVRATLVITAWLLGVPAMLVAVAGSPVSARPPSAAEIQAWLQDPLNPAYQDETAEVLAWTVWALITIAVLAVVAGHLRTARWSKIIGYLPPPAQGLAAAILGTAVVATSTSPLVTPPADASAATASDLQDLEIQHTCLATRGSTLPAATGDGRAATPTPAAAQRELDASRWALVSQGGPLTVSAGGRPWTVTVHRGDTLWDIAEEWLGNHDRWPEIYELNAERYDHAGRMRHGDHIEAGWVLDLPDDARPAQGAVPADPAPGPAPTALATPRPGSSPPTPGTHAPASTTTGGLTSAPAATPSAGAGAITLPPATALPPTAAPSRPDTANPTSKATQPARTGAPPQHETPPTPTGTDHQTEHGGVDLGNRGWVTLDVAAAVGALAALLWIQRRRRYRARPLASRRHDPDLTPLPTTVAALQHARLPAEDTDMQPLAPDLPETATVTPAVLGAHRQHGLLRIPDLPARGVGLTGPGAPAAARGVLAAVLTAGGPWSSHTEATIITTRHDLEQLLDTTRLPALERLILVDDPLNEAEHHLLRRARIATDDDLTEPADTPPMPPTVILTAAPTSSRGDRLAAILAVGGRLGITAVLTGDWAQGETWTIAPTGTTTDELRLNTLDPAATLDILTALNEARPSASDDELAPYVQHAPQPAPPTASLTFPNPPPAAAATHTPSAPPERLSATRPPVARPAISVTVLGRPHVRVATDDDDRELRIRRTDGVQILTYLAVEPDGATSDQLMAGLWPEVRPRYARGRFHTTMSELRGLLGDAGHSDTIQRTGERYHLNPDRVTVDLWDLNAAIERASTALDPAAHIADLRTMIDLYTATIAEGYTWLWLAPYREATRRQLLDAHVALADTEADPRTALTHIQNAITIDPYNEDVYQRAMRLHAKLGSTDGIRRTLRALSEKLAELEIRASPQTQQLATELITRLDARHRITGTAA